MKTVEKINQNTNYYISPKYFIFLVWSFSIYKYTKINKKMYMYLKSSCIYIRTQ